MSEGLEPPQDSRLIVPLSHFNIGKSAAHSIDAIHSKILEYLLLEDEDEDEDEEPSEEDRFELYGVIIGARENTKILGEIHSLLCELELQSESSGHFSRLQILKFLTKLSQKSLNIDSVLELMDETLVKDFLKVDFENPLLRSQPDGTWKLSNTDQVNPVLMGLGSENFDPNYLYEHLGGCDDGNIYEGFLETVCDESFIEQDIWKIAEILQIDFDLASAAIYIYQSGESWYPRALYLAVGNPSNEISGYMPSVGEIELELHNEKYDGLCSGMPEFFMEAFFNTPRILVALSCDVVEKGFTEIFEIKGNQLMYVNLLPALIMSRKNFLEVDRSKFISNFLTEIDFDFEGKLFDPETSAIDVNDYSCTNDLAFISACLYTQDLLLLGELAECDCEIVQTCVLLNPSSTPDILSKLSFSQKFAFSKSANNFLGDATGKGLSRESFENVIDFTSYLAERVRDLEFVKILKDRT
jgi:hypothetical protein